MGTFFRFCNIIASITASALMLVNHAEANMPEPFDLQGTYMLTYGKIPIGKVEVSARQQGVDYFMDANASLVGVAKIFSSHTSSNTVKGTLAETNTRDFARAEREFQTRYSSREGERSITLGYAPGGKLIKEEEGGGPDLRQRPEVPAAKKDGVADTMSMVFALREAIYALRQNKQQNVGVSYYDGKRLSRVNITVHGTVSRSWKGVEQSVVKVGLVREPLAGHTEKELKRLKAMKEILIYFTDDASFKPILGDLPTSFGMFRAELR